MELIILSKDKVINFTSPLRYAVIGAVSPRDTHPPLQEGYVARVQLYFYYIDFEHSSYPTIKEQDAVDVLDFVEKYKDKVDLFVIHCNAGISRSSGVAAALSFIYNGDDSWVFNDRRYLPNMKVREKILSEAQKRGLLSGRI